MSYEVVARRWRPLTFGSVVGQAHVTTPLANAIARDRLPHAFLFTGVRGVGKTTMARLLARVLNCTDRQEIEPCNQCPACKQSLLGSSVDIIEIDAASHTGVDEVRVLIEGAHYRPAAGRFKTYIIDEVHQLSRHAFNALLKTLEEPPDHVKFILATTESHKIPATVLSRCQRYDFHRLSEDQIAGQLAHIATEDGVAIKPDGLALIAREADGSMRDAQSLFEQVATGATEELGEVEVATLLGIAGRELVLQTVSAVVNGDPAEVVQHVAAVRRSGHDSEKFLHEILTLLRHVAVASAAGPKALDASLAGTTRELAERLAGQRTQLDLQRIFSSLLGTAGDLRRGSQPDLVLEMGLIKVASLEPVSTAGEILARLEEMSGGSSGGGTSGGGTAAGARGATSGGRTQTSASGRTAATTSSRPQPSPSAEPGRQGQTASSAGQGASSVGKGASSARQPSRAADQQRSVAASANANSGTSAAADTRGDAATIGAQVSDTSGADISAAPISDSRQNLPAAGHGSPQDAAPSRAADSAPDKDDSDDLLAPNVPEGQAENWEAFLGKVRKEFGLDLYVTLTSCEVTAITETLLELRPSAKGFAERLANRTVMQRVKRLAAAHFGDGVIVRVLEPGAAASAGAAAAGDPVSMQGLEDDRAAKRRQAAVEDPLVRHAVEQLGGRVSKVSLIEE